MTIPVNNTFYSALPTVKTRQAVQSPQTFFKTSTAPLNFSAKYYPQYHEPGEDPIDAIFRSPREVPGRMLRKLADKMSQVSSYKITYSRITQKHINANVENASDPWWHAAVYGSSTFQGNEEFGRPVHNSVSCHRNDDGSWLVMIKVPHYSGRKYNTAFLEYTVPADLSQVTHVTMGLPMRHEVEYLISEDGENPYPGNEDAYTPYEQDEYKDDILHNMRPETIFKFPPAAVTAVRPQLLRLARAVLQDKI